jgi:hypothetical protein
MLTARAKTHLRSSLYRNSPLFTNDNQISSPLRILSPSSLSIHPPSPSIPPTLLQPPFNQPHAPSSLLPPSPRRTSPTTLNPLPWKHHLHLLPIEYTPPKHDAEFGAPAQRTPTPLVAWESFEWVARNAVERSRWWRRVRVSVAHEVG